MAILTRSAGRALWLDVARGGALIAMVAYHFSFDLLLFGMADWPVGSHPAWRTFAAAIASTFLFSAGVSLGYAHGAGIRWHPFLRRLAILAACAALVTIGTMATMPAPIYFGILHAIATFSVLALPFLRAPVWLTVGAAILVLFAPTVLASPFFNAGVFYPLGLAEVRPFTFDYEPIFPWFSVVLLGVAFARLRPLPQMRSEAEPVGPILGALAFLGRHSLIVYILHQPILFGLFMGFAALR